MDGVFQKCCVMSAEVFKARAYLISQIYFSPTQCSDSE